MHKAAYEITATLVMYGLSGSYAFQPHVYVQAARARDYRALLLQQFNQSINLVKPVNTAQRWAHKFAGDKSAVSCRWA